MRTSEKFSLSESPRKTTVHVTGMSGVSCGCERSLGLLGASQGETNEVLMHIVSTLRIVSF